MMVGRSAVVAFAAAVLGLPQLISGAVSFVAGVPGGEVPAPTCKAVTVNYITHYLPQQCLRTSQSIAVITATVGSDGSSSVVDVQMTMATTATTTAAVAATTVPTRGLHFGKPNTNVGQSHTTKAATVAREALHFSAVAPEGSKSTAEPTVTMELPKESDPDDSPLDTANFLSFEEWRAQNLAKAGQSTENFEQRVREPRKDPRAINNVLDSLGEDSEIELDFGFDSVPEYRVGRADRAATPAQSEAPGGYSRSKDAGKTCKERFNYASFDCAATVHKTNPGSKGATSILVENKDSYMRNKCNQENKFFVVELCEDILVDTVVLANFEFFSSMFRTFRVSVSDRYPVKQNGWKDLGTFEARNSRQVQAFLIENPLIWARYLRVELLTHYGNEFYCPVSLLRVHGTTMMEEFRHQEELARGDIEDDVREDVVPEAVAVGIEEGIITPALTEEERPTESYPEYTALEPDEAPVEVYKSNPEHTVKRAIVDIRPDVCKPKASNDVSIFQPLGSPVCGVVYTPSTTLQTVKSFSEPATLILAGSVSTASPATSKTVPPVAQTSSKEPIIATPSAQSSPQREATSTVAKPHIDSAAQEVKHNNPQQQQHYAPPPSHPHPPNASPTTQESFFKTVHKRLQLLEQNATLSLQYIEDQSRILRDAFVKVEKRQMEKTTNFIAQLNSTFLTELLLYKQQYDQLWQSTVIALESQREQSEREMVAVSTRLTILADEMIFQKRMYQIQSVLLLITIGVVIFSRNGNLDTPLLQHMRTRSNLRMLDTPPSSPLPGITPGRVVSHRRSSGDSISSPTFELSPPPPDDYPILVPRRGSTVPILPGTQSSPAIPSGARSRRSWGHQFGPKLKVENKGRRWQRLPSPLGSVAGEEYVMRSPGSEEDERAVGLDGEVRLQGPSPSPSPEPSPGLVPVMPTPDTSSSESSSS